MVSARAWAFLALIVLFGGNAWTQEPRRDDPPTEVAEPKRIKAPQKSGGVAPLTAIEVPALIADPKPVTAPKLFLDLVGPDREVVASPQYGFKMGGKPVTDDTLISQLRADVERIWVGELPLYVFLDSDGKVQHEKGEITVIFGTESEGRRVKFPDAAQGQLQAQFVTHFRKVLFHPRREALKLASGAKLYFGILVDGKPAASEDAEKKVQTAIRAMLSGKDAPELNTDETGNLTLDKSQITIIFYANESGEELRALKASEAALALQARRLTRQVLIVERGREGRRRESVRLVILRLQGVRDVLDKPVGEDRAARLEELKKAKTSADEIKKDLEKLGGDDANIRTALAAIPDLIKKIDAQVEKATYPIDSKLAAGCDHFKLRQDAANVWSLRVKEGGTLVGRFREQPKWVTCSGKKAVVYAKWLDTVPTDSHAAGEISRKLTPGGSDLTSDTLASETGLVILVVNDTDLVAARRPPAKAEVASAEIVDAAGKALLRYTAKGVTDVQYELFLDGSNFRTRVLTAKDWKGFAFFLAADNSVDVVSVSETEEKALARLRGLDLTKAVLVGETLAFVSTGVTPADKAPLKGVTLEKLNSLKDKAAAYAFVGGELILLAAPEDGTSYESVTYERDRKRLILNLAGSSILYREVTLAGTDLMTRLKVPPGCGEKYTFVVKGASEIELRKPGEKETLMAKIANLDRLACVGDSVALLVSRFEAINDALTDEASDLPTGLTKAVLAKGLDAKRAVVIVRGERVFARVGPLPGLTIKSLASATSGYDIEWEGELAMKTTLGLDGKWTGVTWLGSRKAPLLLTVRDQVGTALIIQDDTWILKATGARSVAGKAGKTGRLVFIANKVEPNGKALKHNLIESTLSVEVEAEKPIVGKQLAFFLEGTTLRAVLQPEAAKDGDGFEATTVLESTEKTWSQRLWITGNDEYTLKLDVLKGKVRAERSIALPGNRFTWEDEERE